MQFFSYQRTEKKPGVFALFFSIFSALITLSYIRNSGGVAIELPLNLLTLMVIGCAYIYVFFRYRLSRSYYKNAFLLVGVVALMTPWLLDIKASQGGVLLLVALLAWQYLAKQSMSQYHRRYILWMVFLLALGQAAICAVQSFLPQLAGSMFEYVWLRSHGRPYGIFQQINVLASFLATGLGCGFLLLRTEEQKFSRVFIMLGLGGLAFMLGINQSRVGELGVAVILVSLSIVLKGEIPALRVIIAWSVIVLALVTGVWCVNHLHFMINGKEYLLAREFAGSNYNRWHVLKITLQMIALKPWFGWGYGTFEYAFSRYVIAHPELNFPLTENFTHPHNELLYAWFQGGVVAFAGMLLLFAGWIKILIEGFRHSRLSAAYALLILPFLLHLNTEYPFYQSFVHFALFVLLLRLGVVDEPGDRALNSRSSSLSMRLLYAVTGISLLTFGLVGLYANQQLTQFERSGLINFSAETPWYFETQSERAKFDGMVSLLMKYNRSSDPETLMRFMLDAEEYSHHHNDKRVLIYMSVVAHKLGNDELALQMRKLCMQLFPS
jgi:O-antigen polymerase